MRLTTFTDYSLRVLIYLGLKGEGRSTINEIAAAYDVSQNHLMKIVQHLSAMGYVDSARGKGGGIRLGADPAGINIGDVVRACERNMSLVECFEPNHSCCIEKTCMLKGLFHEASEAFLQVLEKYSLHDLLGPGRELSHRLGINARPGPPGRDERTTENMQ